MTQHKYTVDEISRMRKIINFSYPSGTQFGPGQQEAQTENLLRTFMINGTTVEELDAAMGDHDPR